MKYKGSTKKNLLTEGMPLSYNNTRDIQKLGIESIKGLDTKTY